MERKVGWGSESWPCHSSLDGLPGVGTASGGDGAEPYSRLTLESSKLPAESQGKRNCR